MRRIRLLGPQRLRPTLADELESLEVEGPLAVVTAGWQERELEDDELRQHVGRPVENLRLHGRSEELFQEDRDLFRAHRDRQTRLQELQRLYRFRLDFVMEPARELLSRDNTTPLLVDERLDAVDAVRRLDERHRERIELVHERFEKNWQPLERDAVRKHRDELRDVVERSGALLVAGGHVAVLLNRLRLFGIFDLLPPDRPVVAWSAGAMVCGESVVLFHDRPPQGAGNAEVFENGFGLYPALVPLPHATRRLRLDDPVRVALMARRLAPAAAVPLDDGAGLEWDGERWHPRKENRRLFEDGRLIPLEVA